MNQEIKYNVFKNQKEYIDTDKYHKYITHNGYSRPIMLIIETVNICNNKCIICAYSKISRKQDIMSHDIFRKTIKDYIDLGGGPLSLTPVVGEVFLDKELISRYKEILQHPEITQVSFTTNATKSSNFNDDNLIFILKNTYRIHISIYGMDEEEYYLMTGRKGYTQLVNSIKRILSLVDDTNKIVFGFRSLRKYEDQNYRAWIFDNFEIEIPFASTNHYANWGVLDTKNRLPFDASWIEAKKVTNQCMIPLVACQVFVNGSVSFCPCDDFDSIDELHLGSIQNNTLLEIYNSSRTKELWNFKQQVPQFCEKCSFFKPITELKENEYMYENPHYFIGG